MRGIDCALTGRLGRDAERRATKDGRPMVVLNVAVDEGEGEAGPAATTWARVLAFGDQAEAAAELVKGAEVYVEGRLRLESWTGRDDVARAGLVVLARLVQPLGRIGRRRPRKRAMSGAAAGEGRPAADRAPAGSGAPPRGHPAPAGADLADDGEPFNDDLPF